MHSKKINVYCHCGQVLFVYQKVGKGRLIKLFKSRIESSNSLIDNDEGKHYCPLCHAETGTETLVRGKPAIRLNQANIRKTVV